MSLALVAAPIAFEPRDLGAQCNRCPLGGEKRKPVPPQLARGVTKLIIVGEAPGRYEVVMNRPFIGPSGKILDDMLREKGFDRRDAHVTNAALCKGETDEQIKAATACCAVRLGNELAALPKEAPILALGASCVKPILGRGAILKVRGFVWKVPEVTDQQLRAATKVLERRLGGPRGRRLTFKKASADVIQKARASLWFLQGRRLIQGRVVIPSLHPAFLLRGADAWRPVFAVDVDRAVRWSRAPFPLEDEGPYVESCDPRVVKRTLSKMRSHVAVDIETSGVDPLQATITCVGISDDHDGLGTTLVISPWKSSLGPLLNAALRKRTAITHNGPSFDELALNRRKIRLPHHEDTLIGHHAFASHLRQGLDHVASVFCDSGPWKVVFKAKGAEEKGGLAKYSTASEDLARYNAADVRLDIRCWVRMQTDLNTERNVYNFDMRVAKELCQEMQRNGLLVDQARRADLAKKLKFRAAALLGEMRSLLRRPSFNPGSLPDLRRALFVQCKAPQWLGPATSTGLPSTGKLVLEALRGSETRAGKLADLIMRRRSAKDIRSEYLVNIPIGKDGRVHPMWKSFGTISGRFATARPNVLNMPRVSEDDDPDEYEKQIRDIYIAPRGKKFVYFDLAQSEPKFAAWISGDANFIETCQGDVHTNNACILFPKQADLIRANPKGKIEELPSGKKFRQIAKSCGLAVTYLAEAPTVYATLHAAGFDVSLPEVEALLRTLNTRYRTYFKYTEANVDLCRKQGFIRSPFLGRIIWMGFYPKPSSVANWPCQSGVADVMNERLLQMQSRLPRGVKLVFCGYDSACYETPDESVGLMQKLLTEQWSVPIAIPGTERTFVQAIELKTGTRLSEL